MSSIAKSLLVGSDDSKNPDTRRVDPSLKQEIILTLSAEEQAEVQRRLNLYAKTLKETLDAINGGDQANEETTHESSRNEAKARDNATNDSKEDTNSNKRSPKKAAVKQEPPANPVSGFLKRYQDRMAKMMGSNFTEPEPEPKPSEEVTLDWQKLASAADSVDQGILAEIISDYDRKMGKDSDTKGSNGEASSDFYESSPANSAATENGDELLQARTKYFKQRMELFRQRIELFKQSKKYAQLLKEMKKLPVHVDEFLATAKKVAGLPEDAEKEDEDQKVVELDDKEEKPVKGKDDSLSSCEVTLEYDQDGQLLSSGSGADDMIKKSINDQIVKALKTLKLGDAFEDVISGAISRSIEDNSELLEQVKGNDQKTTDKKSPKSSPSIDINVEAQLSSGAKKLQDKNVPKPHGNEKQQTTRPPVTSPETNTVNKAPKANKKSRKKKRKKKKKSASEKNKHKGGSDPRSQWVCDFCEYEKVFGEKPVYLLEWYDKKLEEQERREAYQRQKMRHGKRGHGMRRSASQASSSGQMSPPPPPPISQGEEK